MGKDGVEGRFRRVIEKVGFDEFDIWKSVPSLLEQDAQPVQTHYHRARRPDPPRQLAHPATQIKYSLARVGGQKFDELR